MTVAVIIARYNENLDWLFDLVSHFFSKNQHPLKLFIYNKGKDDIDQTFLDNFKQKTYTTLFDFYILPLENIGRESHTYLNHIIQNYDNLDDVNVFCQGDSIFHSPNFIDLISNFKDFQHVQPLSAFYWKHGEPPFFFNNPPLSVINKTKQLYVDGGQVHVEYLNQNFVTMYPSFYKERYFASMINFLSEHYDISNYYRYLIDKLQITHANPNMLFPICFAGLFAVNKVAIKDNAKEYYENIMDYLLHEQKYNSHNILIDNGLFLEKMWLVIFNYMKYNKNYIELPMNKYQLTNKKIKINDNCFYFSIFYSVFDLYMLMNIDDVIYSLYIVRDVIIFTKLFEKVKMEEVKEIKNKLEENNLIDSFDEYVSKKSKDREVLLKKSLVKKHEKNRIAMFSAIKKEETTYEIFGCIKKNTFMLEINKQPMVSYMFKYPVKILKKVVLFDVANYNKFREF